MPIRRVKVVVLPASSAFAKNNREYAKAQLKKYEAFVKLCEQVFGY
jgi:hypothetical protein